MCAMEGGLQSAIIERSCEMNMVGDAEIGGPFSAVLDVSLVRKTQVAGDCQLKLDPALLEPCESLDSLMSPLARTARPTNRISKLAEGFSLMRALAGCSTQRGSPSPDHWAIRYPPARAH